jgi:tetratricopeptide (TPR) repeat protein
MKIKQRPNLFRAIRFVAVLAGTSLSLASMAGDKATQPEAEADAQPSKEQALLFSGRHVLEQGDPQRAITEFFDPVVQHYENAYKGSAAKIYSAQNMQQALIYSALPHEGRSVEVLDSSWADAYLMKGYALIELRQMRDAQDALEKAIVLSPMNAQYLSELAYVFQVEGDCDKSIETYARAQSMAELGSQDETKTSDMTRALRGQGYCLVEQGKLDEAEAMYQKALKLDPHDTKSLDEFGYIKNLSKK